MTVVISEQFAQTQREVHGEVEAAEPLPRRTVRVPRDVVQQVDDDGQEDEEHQRGGERAERDAADVAVERAHRRSCLQHSGRPTATSSIAGSQPQPAHLVVSSSRAPSTSPR